jgi:competence protein ComGC
MTNRKVHSLFRNNTAVVGKPIALLVILIIAGVILTLFFLMIPDLIKETQRQNVEGELDKIVVEATTMFEYAENGTCKTIAVKFPSSLRFVVFGSAPTHGTNEPTNLNLDEHTSNNYYYVMDDGTIHPFHSNARFSNHNMTQIALFHPGSYTITLRLCEKGRNTYVTMQ